MSGIKAWGEEQAEEAERQAFVQHLLDSDALQGAAHGVAAQYVDKGRESLSASQENVLDQYVFGEHLVEECEMCGNSIPMSEQISALDSRICGYCEHKLSKDD